MVFLANNLGDKCTGRLRVTGRKPLLDTFNEMFLSFVIHQPSVIRAAQNVKKIRGPGADTSPAGLGPAIVRSPTPKIYVPILAPGAIDQPH